MQINFRKGYSVTSHILSGSSPGNLYRILADNQFRIGKPYRKRLLKTIFIVLLSTPNILLERLLFNRKIRNTKVTAPVFILGYPRSGTTHLIYLLSKDTRFGWCKTYECLGPHVIFTFGRVLRFIAQRALPKTRPMDNMPLGADLPKEEEFAIANMGIESMVNGLYFPQKFSEYTNRFVLFKGDAREKSNWKRNHLFLSQKLTLKNNNKTLLLKSPFDTGRVKELLELYPDARFIHIYRNPLSVYASNEKLYEGVLPQTAFHEVGDEEMKQHVLYSYKAVYEKYFSEKNLIPKDKLIEVRYEDFIGKELSYLENIYRQLHLTGFEEMRSVYEKMLEKNRHYQTNQHSMTQEQENEVRREWAFAFDAFTDY